MDRESREEELIRRYLLWQVDDDERRQVEERLMTDDEFFLRVNMAEDEMAADYARGALPPAEREQFERAFLSTPERRQQVNFNQLFMRYVERALREDTRRVLAREAPPASVWERCAAFLTLPHPALRAGLALLVIALLAGTGWMQYRVRGLRERVEQARAAEPRPAPDAARQLEGLRRQNDEAEAQLRAAERERDQLQQRLAAAEPRAKRPAEAPVSMVFMMMPGQTHDPGGPPLLRLGRGDLLTLALTVQEGGSPSYDAVMRSGAGRHVRSWRGLRPRTQDGRESVLLRLPAARLAAGNYYVILRADGREVDRYDFRVERD